jgi:T5SS/PEP-CTERM-associated repeat protein
MQRTELRVRRAAITWVMAALLLPAQAAVTTTGAISLQPDPGFALGPGDVNLPDTVVVVGFGRQPATFAATAGSQVTIAYLNVVGGGIANTTALLDGAGTRMNLSAVGTTNRFGLGNARGRGSMVISGGAVLDGSYQLDRCDSGGACQNVVAAAAGSQGALTVTGAGSEAHFARHFHVGSLAYNGATGIAGQNAEGTINVLAGGLLTTQWPSLGGGYNGSNLNGSERGIAQVTVAGAQSRWLVTGSAFIGGAARLQAALDPQGVVRLDVNQGGELRVAASPAGQESSMLLGLGGSFSGTVSGTGSRIVIDGDGSSGLLQIGANAGQGLLNIEGGATLDARVRTVRIGVNGGQGKLDLSGAGSTADFGSGEVHISDGSSSGWVRVSSGATLHADRMVIASSGLLSGSGTVTVRELVNDGTINPGDSPGSLQLAGSLRGSGRIVLEVEANGSGFDTDALLLTASPDLAAMAIEFRFLGATDPNAFLASGAFDIDTFLRLNGSALPDSAFAGVSFSATAAAFDISNFSYSPATGASFTAVPVPEPATWITLAAGLCGLLWRASGAGWRRPAASADQLTAGPR